MYNNALEYVPMDENIFKQYFNQTSSVNCYFTVLVIVIMICVEYRKMKKLWGGPTTDSCN